MDGKRRNVVETYHQATSRPHCCRAYCSNDQRFFFVFVNTGSVVHWHRKSIGSTRMRGTSPIHNNARILPRGVSFFAMPRGLSSGVIWSRRNGREWRLLGSLWSHAHMLRPRAQGGHGAGLLWPHAHTLRPRANELGNMISHDS
jgi:hypothetical protein